MSDHDTIEVRAIVTLSTAALQTIVSNAKAIVGANAKGHYRVDTAGLVNRMISKFLMEKNFAAWVADTANYPALRSESMQ